ncbi:MAG: helicase-exonuclease AddAB subunit AddB [Peptococcaceae bacterium]|nr:helicase-exonuclease AddAB subunit AddB [Peptococcaceae bacterium]
MSLRFILGRANSGKSTLIYDEITRQVQSEPDGPPLWLLVPEQATFQVEQALAERLGGIMRVRVVSFKRLAYNVMNHVAGAALTPISDLGRRMLVRKIIEEHKRDLKLFARAASYPGFADKVVELISELKRYRVKPQQLNELLTCEAAIALPPTLRSKLHDLSIIYSHLAAKYVGVAFDTEDCLEWLAEHVSAFTPLSHTQVWVDGFTGFSPQEYGTIERLLRMSDVHMCVTVEPNCIEEQLVEGHPFYGPWETIVQVRSLATHAGVPITVVALGPDYSSEKVTDLSYLEQAYFERDSVPFTGSVLGIELNAVATRRAEVEVVAREIVRLCREEGYRYRDLCLIVRDVALYDSFVRTVFTTHDIPVFIDKKRKVRHHPLLDLIRASLEAVLQDFPYEPVMRCLKSGLFSLAGDEVDFLDNFVLATGIRGNRWLDDSDWRIPKSLSLGQENNEGLSALINSARKKVSAHFRALARGLRAATDVQEYSQAIYTFLEGLDVPATLGAWAEEAAREGDLDTVGLHLQVFDSVSQLLQEVETTLGDEYIMLPEFARILETGLEGISLGLIPPGLDQVIVAELGRSRSPLVRGAFVLGVNEGIMPAKSQVEGLLSDEERECLSSFNVALGPTSRRQLFDEDYLVYTGLTRPREFLRISYAVSDVDGAPLSPSLVIKRIREIFPNLSISSIGGEPPSIPAVALSYLQHHRSAVGFLATELRRAKSGNEVSDLWWDVFTSLLEHPTGRTSVATAVRGLYHQVRLDPLSAHLVSQLYGKTIRGSVSRLERFRACPFSYFAAYGLKLRERPIYRLAAVDLGNFFHAALDRFVDALCSQKLDWAALSRDQYKSITQEVVDAIIPELDSDVLLSTARYRHLTQRLQRVVERSARVLGHHAERGSFRPIGVEVGFGGHGDALPALKIELADGTTLEIVGRIDRIDTAEAEGRLYLRIIDYKSGHSRLTPLEVYYGLKIQLLTYLEVALVNALTLLGREAIPAGALYFRLQDPLLVTDGPLDFSASEEMSLKEFKNSGLVVADSEAIELMEQGLQGWSQVLPVMAKADGTYAGDGAWDMDKLKLMLAHVRNLNKAAGESIVRGTIDIAPYRLSFSTACQYCEYLPICQFDCQLPDGSYRELAKMASEEVWSILDAERGDEE